VSNQSRRRPKTTRDTKRRSRDETYLLEVFDPDAALADTEWGDHIAAIIRVSRIAHRRVTAKWFWETTSEVVYFVTEFPLPAATCARTVRHHWAIENRSHYVRDSSFREDNSRIRRNPGMFARLRSFAANILRFNDVENISDPRYRIAIGGSGVLRLLRFV